MFLSFPIRRSVERLLLSIDLLNIGGIITLCSTQGALRERMMKKFFNLAARHLVCSRISIAAGKEMEVLQLQVKMEDYH